MKRKGTLHALTTLIVLPLLAGPVGAVETGQGAAGADRYSEEEQQAMIREAYKTDPDLLKKTSYDPMEKEDGETGKPDVKDCHRPCEETMDGIDISNWQAGIDLDAVEFDFLIAKATGGVSFVDRQFERFVQSAIEQEKPFGFYHFANDGASRASGRVEAAHFYQIVKPYLGQGIPILDYEARHLLTSGTGWALEFLDTFYQLSGVRCMVYTGQWAASALDWSNVAQAGYPLWVARYDSYELQEGYRENPSLQGTSVGDFGEYWMHQYTSNGRLEGYDGALDLSRFYGSREDWKALTQREGQFAKMHRVYNPNSGEHFYTGSSAERDGLVSLGWQDEGSAWHADRDGIEIYRLYNPNDGDHHYTADAAEARALVSFGWQDEGIGWMGAKQGKPVYRLYNPNAKCGAHLFTTDENEAKALVSYGWQDEGIAWYDVVGLD